MNTLQTALILGGYGNFGQRISMALAKKNIPIIIAGRSKEKALDLTNEIKKVLPEAKIDIATFDVNTGLDDYLKKQKPKVVINTCGPFQTADYSVAKCCIANQVNYIDLSDGRDFVTGITELDQAAKENKVLVVSGASTVPGLSSAVLDFYKDQFASIDSFTYGISPGQKAPRGLATTQGILTYLGKPLKPIQGLDVKHYGWQDLYKQEYPELGKRWMANCDIPDLDLFPAKYGMRTIQFSAGMENTFLHLGMWMTSWLVRLGLPVDLSKHAQFLLKLSTWFDYFGSPDGGMHIIIKGMDHAGNPKEVKWFIVAKNSDGPQIPCVPAIFLANKIINGQMTLQGAMPCVSMITLEEYLAELKDFAIQTYQG